jgi:hypothetical protein
MRMHYQQPNLARFVACHNGSAPRKAAGRSAASRRMLRRITAHESLCLVPLHSNIYAFEETAKLLD